MKNTIKNRQHSCAANGVCSNNKKQKGFSILADYTDVFVQLIMHYLTQKLGQFAQYR